MEETTTPATPAPVVWVVVFVEEDARTGDAVAFDSEDTARAFVQNTDPDGRWTDASDGYSLDEFESHGEVVASLFRLSVVTKS